MPRPRPAPILGALLLALGLVALPAPVSATWSVIAVDLSTGRVVVSSAIKVSGTWISTFMRAPRSRAAGGG